MPDTTAKSLSNAKIITTALGVLAIIILVAFFGAKPCSVNILGVSLQFSCDDEDQDQDQDTTDPIAGTWRADAGVDNAQIDILITVSSGCEPGNICGTINLPTVPCQASIYLRDINGNRYDYDAVDHQGNCGPAGNEYLELNSDGTLSQWYNDGRTVLRRK